MRTAEPYMGLQPRQTLNYTTTTGGTDFLSVPAASTSFEPITYTAPPALPSVSGGWGQPKQTPEEPEAYDSGRAAANGYLGAALGKAAVGIVLGLVLIGYAGYKKCTNRPRPIPVLAPLSDTIPLVPRTASPDPNHSSENPVHDNDAERAPTLPHLVV
jgi:hypothetical protein